MSGQLFVNADSEEAVRMSEFIEAHARYLRARGLSPITVDSRIRILWHLHRDLPFGLAYASTDELEDFLQSDLTWSAWTRSTYAMHIRGFYKWANGRILAGDPAAEMARPRAPKCVPHPVTTEELEIALERSPEPWYTAIMLAAYAGLRASELAAVRREHVTERLIRIPQAKGGDPASVDTHPVIWDMVKSRPAGPLAVRPSGRPLSGHWLTARQRAHFDKIGMPDVTLHRFRHWFGTMLLDAGNDLRTVQESLRHRSITSTEGYTLVSGGQRRLAIRSLPTPNLHPREH